MLGVLITPCVHCYTQYTIVLAIGQSIYRNYYVLLHIVLIMGSRHNYSFYYDLQI